MENAALFKNCYVTKKLYTQILKQHISMELIIPSIINICKTNDDDDDDDDNLSQVRPW